jgi:ABC-type cobalamin/Fe3+-siderophores transport system ATPase subunit
VLECQRILQNLSFSVERGETVMIIGPNGAGKPTLLRAFMGFLPCEGNVARKEGIAALYCTWKKQISC